MILEVFAHLNDSQVYVYFNSDTLYLPSIFRDLFVDHSGFNGWHLNGAPNFFPDMLFYFLFNTLIPDFRSAMVVYSLVQYLGLLLLVRWLFRTVFPDISEEALAAGNLVMFIIFLVSFVPGDFVFTFYLLSISYHLGAFLMAVASIIFTFRYLKRGRVYDLIILFTLGILGVLNDKLYMAMYILPLSSIIVLLFSTSFRKKAAALLGNGIIVSLTGTLVYNWIKQSGYIHIISLSWKFMNFSNIPASFHTMISQHLTYLSHPDFRALSIILTLLSFITGAVLAIRFLLQFFRGKISGDQEIVAGFYLVFSSAFWIIVLATPVINGSYVGYAILRYNIYAIYLSLFNFAVFLHIWSKERNKRVNRLSVQVVLIILLLLPVLFFGKPFLRHGIKDVTQYYPDVVRRMDIIAEQRDLNYGLATYWYAKYITMFSRTGVRIYTVYEDLSPWYHVTNENWYHQGGQGKHGNPAFTFVLMDQIHAEKVGQKLGPPLESIPFEGSRINLYHSFVFDRERNVVFTGTTGKD